MAHSHNHSHCIETALDSARALCDARGVRFTKLRAEILEMVWAGHKAVKAYDLLDELAARGGGAKPPTVYRALDFLMEQGFVHKIESLNAFVGCPHAEDEGHVSQFLICDTCRDVREVGTEDLDAAILSEAQKSGFQIKGQTIEIHGLCEQCVG